MLSIRALEYILKQKYSFLGSGLLMLAFVLWTLLASTPAALGMMGDMLFQQLGIGFRIGAFGNYALLGLSELLLLAPLVGYMLLCKVPLRALMGNRTSAVQNVLAVLLGMAVAAGVTGLSVACATFFTDVLHASLPDTSSYDPKTWPQLVAAAVALGVCAGVAEEPVFRGVLLRSFGGVTGKWPAILWSSLIFSLIHMDIVGAPTRFVVGVALGMLAWRSGAILPGMFAHAAYNTTALGMSLVLSSTGLGNWQGFYFLQGMPQGLNDTITWCILSVPFLVAAAGLWLAFDIASSRMATWHSQPYIRQAIPGVHWLAWAGTALVTVALTGLTFLAMYLPQLTDMIPQFGQ